MKREKMKSSSFGKMMIVLAFVAGFSFSFTGKAQAQNTYNGEEVFVVAEEMPSFPGDLKALFQAINSNLSYPEKARENGVEGKVMVKFIVDKDGFVKNPTVIKSVDADLDKAAIDAVKMLPKFKPGKNGGKNVNVYYTIPIAFQLK